MITRRGALLGALTVPALAAPAFAAPRRVRMFELYDEGDGFSDVARELHGQRVAMQGFMAPHLKADADFFILSNTPVETCPFCETEADWIDTIVFVRTRRKEAAVDPGSLLLTEGRLEIGTERDAATGFVSKVRLADAEFRKTGR